MEYNTHKIPIISLISLGIMILAESAALYIIYSADILPLKFFLIIAAILISFSILTALLLLVHGRNKEKPVGTTRKIVSYFLILIVCTGCFCAAKFFYTLTSTFDTVAGDSAALLHYGVYVVSDDPAQSIEDTAAYSYGSSAGYSEDVLNEVSRQAGQEITAANYDNPFQMLAAFYSGEVQAVILDEAYLDIVSEAEPYSDFFHAARCIFSFASEDRSSFDFTARSEAEGGSGAEEIISADPTETPFIMYLSGADSRYDVRSRNRSDVNILAVVNPETCQILLVNTPRDYYISNPAGDGAKDKLTHLGPYGVDCSAKGLSDLYGISIDYTARINFSGFERIIDAVGGITVHPAVTDATYRWRDEMTFDGQSALAFARNRGYEGGDRIRGKHQMEILRALADKLMSGSALGNYGEILESLQGMFTTDMPPDVIADFIKMQLNENPDWSFLSCSADGTDTTNAPYSMPGLYAYCMEPDMDTVHFASGLISRILAGEILTPEDTVYTKPEQP
jgi:LCP family protein required for cell wall assembly